MKGKTSKYLTFWGLSYVVYAFVDSFTIEIPTIVSITFWTLMIIVPLIIEYIKIPIDNVRK